MESRANQSPEAHHDLLQTPILDRGQTRCTRGRFAALTRCASTPIGHDELRALIDFDAEHTLRKSPRRTTRGKVNAADDHDLSKNVSHESDDSGVHSWEHSESPSASQTFSHTSKFELGLSSSLESSAEFNLSSASSSGYSSSTSLTPGSVLASTGARPKTVHVRERDLCFKDGSASLELTTESMVLKKRFNFSIGHLVGKESVDFIKQLNDRGLDKIAVQRIFKQLSPRDLCSVSAVSQFWREAVIFDAEALSRKADFIRESKLNLVIPESESIVNTDEVL